MAALNNDVKTAELCLDNGADMNTRKSKETTPLHIAATKGNLDMAKLLISRGVGVNMKDGESKPPLHRFVYGYILRADKLKTSSPIKVLTGHKRAVNRLISSRSD